MERGLDDDRLLALLGEVLDETDPVPDDAATTARSADLAGTDAELAELVFDSLLDDRDVTMRSGPGAGSEVRSLTFTAGDRTIEIDLTGGELVGRVSPADRPAVEILQGPPAPPVPVEVDDLGRFRATVGPGPLRLRVGTATTPWVTR
jgi:hypothetical protein